MGTMDMMLFNQPPASVILSSLSWPVSSFMPSTRPVLTAPASKTPNTVAPMMTTAEDILEPEAGHGVVEDTTEDLQGVPLLLVVEEGLPRHRVPGQLLDLVERGGDKY